MNWCNDKLTIDLKTGTIVVEGEDSNPQTFPIESRQGFQAMSNLWLRAGWDNKYVYTFSWMGRPVIQLPDDMIRIQEVIYNIKPDVIVETGVAHGGSAIYYASLFKMMGVSGRVIGVDIEIREHNRKAIEAHEMHDAITLIEGPSTEVGVVNQVKELLNDDDRVLILLDSNHSYQHVLNELNTYAELVSPGSYIIATDGIMKDLQGAPRSEADWSTNNPYNAAQDFSKANENFELINPEWPFNESGTLDKDICVSYWPGSWLKRIR